MARRLAGMRRCFKSRHAISIPKIGTNPELEKRARSVIGARMGRILLLLLAASFATSAIGASPEGPAASYQSKKSLAELEKCLTDKLSQRGDVTAVKMAEGTTLMLR